MTRKVPEEGACERTRRGGGPGSGGHSQRATATLTGCMAPQGEKPQPVVTSQPLPPQKCLPRPQDPAAASPLWGQVQVPGWAQRRWPEGDTEESRPGASKEVGTQQSSKHPPLSPGSPSGAHPDRRTKHSRPQGQLGRAGGWQGSYKQNQGPCSPLHPHLQSRLAAGKTPAT